MLCALNFSLSLSLYLIVLAGILTVAAGKSLQQHPYRKFLRADRRNRRRFKIPVEHDSNLRAKANYLDSVNSIAEYSKRLETIADSIPLEEASALLYKAKRELNQATLILNYYYKSSTKSELYKSRVSRRKMSDFETEMSEGMKNSFSLKYGRKKINQNKYSRIESPRKVVEQAKFKDDSAPRDMPKFDYVEKAGEVIQEDGTFFH